MYFKNSQNPIRNNPIFKKWTKDLNVSPEKIHEEQMSSWKDARCHHLSGRCAVKAQGDPSASARMAGSRGAGPAGGVGERELPPGWRERFGKELGTSLQR